MGGIDDQGPEQQAALLADPDGRQSDRGDGLPVRLGDEGEAAVVRSLLAHPERRPRIGAGPEGETLQGRDSVVVRRPFRPGQDCLGHSSGPRCERMAADGRNGVSGAG